jgi:hypothetical protein
MSVNRTVASVRSSVWAARRARVCSSFQAYSVTYGLVGSWLSGTYVSRRIPDGKVRLSARRRWWSGIRSAKRRLPLPSTTGKTMSRYSSIRSAAMSVLARSALPYRTRSPPGCAFSALTSATASPERIVVLTQSACWRLCETTYFGRTLRRWVSSLSGSAACQNADQIW